MNSSTMNDFDDLYIIKKYQVFSNGVNLLFIIYFFLICYILLSESQPNQ